MPVAIQRSSNVPPADRPPTTATVAVTIDVADLITAMQAGTMTAARAKAEAVRRAAVELHAAAGVAIRTDAQIDADAAAATAEAARLKALRPSGSF